MVRGCSLSCPLGCLCPLVCFFSLICMSSFVSKYHTSLWNYIPRKHWGLSLWNGHFSPSGGWRGGGVAEKKGILTLPTPLHLNPETPSIQSFLIGWALFQRRDGGEAQPRCIVGCGEAGHGVQQDQNQQTKSEAAGRQSAGRRGAERAALLAPRVSLSEGATRTVFRIRVPPDVTALCFGCHTWRVVLQQSWGREKHTWTVDRTLIHQAKPTVGDIHLSSTAQSVGEHVKKALLLTAARRQNITRHGATKFVH